jgi:hypothetical protein
MTKITTDFSGFERATIRLAKLHAIYDFWLGSGAFAAAGTLGIARTELNNTLPINIENKELFDTWYPKWNVLNEPDKLISDTLSGTSTSCFILAHDTERLFGADGVNFNTIPEARVLALSDIANLTLGNQLWTNIGVTGVGSSIVANGAGWNVTATVTDFVGIQQTIPSLTIGSGYLVQASWSGNLNSRQIYINIGGSSLLLGSSVSGSASIVGVPLNGATALQLFATSLTISETITLTMNSVRQVLNFADYLTLPVPGRTISLIGDDWEGLELGADLRSSWNIITVGSPSPVATYNPATGAGTANRVDGSNSSGVRFTATDTKMFLLHVIGITGTLSIRGNGAAGTILGTITTDGRYVIYTNVGDDIIVTSNAGTVSFIVLSLQEVLNSPAYQSTTTARPTWGRAPIQVRNLITPTTALNNAAWTKIGVTVTEGAEGNPEAATIQRTAVNSAYHAYILSKTSAKSTYTYSTKVKRGVGDFFVVTIQGNGSANRARVTFNILNGTISITGSAIGGLSFLGASIGMTDDEGFRRVSISFTTDAHTQIGAFQAPSINSVVAVDSTNADTTANCIVKEPQFEFGVVATATQRRAPTQPDITETDVISYGILSFDGSDDALLHRIYTGGTISVALFGRGGSYLIPSITLAAQSILSIGPLSVLDDGIIVSGCPTGILRAIGATLWSSRFEVVGIAIMKENPSLEEQTLAMRYFAAHGARGWLIEGGNILSNGGFDSDLTGWDGYQSDRTWQAGSARIMHNNTGFPRFFNTVSGWQLPRNTLIRWRMDLLELLGDASSPVMRFGDPAAVLNNLAPTAEFPLSVGINTGFYVSDSQNRIFGALITGGTFAGGAGFRLDNLSLQPFIPEF